MKNESYFQGSFFWFHLCYFDHFQGFGYSYFSFHKFMRFLNFFGNGASKICVFNRYETVVIGQIFKQFGYNKSNFVC